MPSDGSTVRGLLALRARHEALAGFWHAKAGELGLTSDAGIAAADQALKHGTRAERLAVTALDVATKLAKKPKPLERDAYAQAMAEIEAEKRSGAT